jgi:hypothetical protein
LVAGGERGSMGEQLLEGPITILFSEAEGCTDGLDRKVGAL